tara:strand:- start:273 stop:506 length:234 start_codon:yes stop_codon:yes gene_type:complete
MGVQTQGDYRFESKITGSKNRIKELVTQDVFQVLEKYEKAMIMYHYLMQVKPRTLIQSNYNEPFSYDIKESLGNILF